MGLRKRLSREPEKQPENAGKVWLKQRLKDLSTEIYRVEESIKVKQPGSRLRSLKELVSTYNHLLGSIYGKENAQRLLNFKVNGSEVEMYIPAGKSTSPNTRERGRKKVARKRRLALSRIRKGSSLQDFSDLGFDSTEIALAYIVDVDMSSGQPSLLYYR